MENNKLILDTLIKSGFVLRDKKDQLAPNLVAIQTRVSKSVDKILFLHPDMFKYEDTMWMERFLCGIGVFLIEKEIQSANPSPIETEILVPETSECMSHKS